MWTEKFSVLHSGIDEQHKVLFDIIDEVAEALKNKDYSFEKTYDVITKLDDYIKEHFSFEENLMKKYSYPERENHISQHNRLRDRINGFNVFDVTKPKAFYEETLVFLIDWLSGHILLTDKKLGLYLEQQS